MNEDVELTEAHIVVQENELSQSVIETELHRLETVLKLYFRKKYKLELCLKLKYGIGFNLNELKVKFPQYSLEDLQILSADFKEKRMNDIFGKVIQVFNKYDRKMKNGDSLRKWINRKEEDIIEKMNIFHKHPIYHKKSLRMLFQVYFDQIMYSDNN